MLKIEENNKTLTLNKLLALLATMSFILAMLVITLFFFNTPKIEKIIKSGEAMKVNYATTESNTWDVSEAEDGSVIASLSEDGVLTISGEGEMKSWGTNTSVPWCRITKQIKQVKIEEGVTSIGAMAFYYCSNLTEITIPDSVTSINNIAFKQCSALTEITISVGVTSITTSAFSGCNSLINIKVKSDNPKYCDVNGILYTKDKKQIVRYPEGKQDSAYIILDGVTSIGNFAFEGCTNLKEIMIPEGVININSGAFNMCTNLTEIKIPEGTISICDRTFYGCSSLTELTIPSSVTSIGEWVFFSCSSLEKIKVDTNNIKYCDEDGIVYTKDKTEIIRYPEGKQDSTYTILEGVIRIEKQTFAGCSNLKEIMIPQGVTSIGEWAFYKCNGLTEMTIPSSVITIGNTAFRDCSNLTKITLPKGLTKIEDNLFYECISLTELVIPEGVTDIEDVAFRGCSNLAELNVPEGVTNIGDCTFASCKGLTRVTLPKSVTEIGKNAFYECDKLTILCYKDSYAETYAIENQIPYQIIDLSSAENEDSSEDDTTVNGEIPKAGIEYIGIIILIIGIVIIGRISYEKYKYYKI